MTSQVSRFATRAAKRTHADTSKGAITMCSTRAILALVLLAVPYALAADEPRPTSDPGIERPEAVDEEALRTAIRRALEPIERSAREYPKHRDCFSCHHQAVPALALTTARGRGFPIEAESLEAILDVTLHDLTGAEAAYRRHEGQGGGVTRAGYALWTLDLLGHPADDTTRAVSTYIDDLIKARDHWRTSSSRPPSEASAFTTTYVALRALSAYPVTEDSDVSERKDALRAWLEATEAKETEELVFRLWSLHHFEPGAASEKATTDALLALQNEDGGWPQLPEGASDAYATGTALVALNLAGGLATDTRTYERGLAYLLRSQGSDGTWMVKSRSKPFQPYFESGFPYGSDQFISITASAWATTALALALPAP